MTKKLKIDPELQALIPPLPLHERAALRASLKADGLKDPIVIWRGVIVDGHNRYELCQELGIPIKTRARTFKSRAAVRAWMLHNQLARRNLTPDQLIMLHVLQGAEPPMGSPHQHRKARALVEQHPDKATRVLHDPNFSLTIAHNLAFPKPRTRRAPVARDAAQISVEHRATEQAREARKDAKQLAARVVELEDRLAWMHSEAAHPPKIVERPSRPRTGKREATPVFMVSDTHFGEVVTRAETLGVNEYNLTIARARMSKCWDNMLWLRDDMSRTQTCDDTLLCLNGDIVTGDIHDELRETNDVGLRGQCDFALEVLIPGIRAMAEATPRILHITCIGGNHGRVTPRQQIKNGTEHSVEHMGIYDPLRRIIGDMGGKIAWHIPQAERFAFGLYNRRISIQHGTMIRSSGGIGGVLVPMQRWVTRSADADLYLFGHFHEADAYGKIVKNGSLIGESGYSRWLGVESRPAEQVAFVLDARAGLRRFERVSVT